MTSDTSIRVATYNIHKCCGLDRRVSPERIAKVLEQIGADIAALQEVLISQGHSQGDQARYIAERLGYHYVTGENRRHRGGAYGNVILTRFPVLDARNYDLTVGKNEKRGCLRVDISRPDGKVLHIFNVHLGTAFLERRQQGRKLLAEDILRGNHITGPRIVLGDFNEWTRGLTTRLLKSHLESADVRNLLRRTRTYPGILPFLHLDHIYYDPELRLHRLTLHKSRTALIASDHLPLVGDFLLNGAGGSTITAAPTTPLVD